MYCPNCAAQNNDGVSYCRACGTNLSLISRAITGKIPGYAGRRGHRDERRRPPDFGHGLMKLFGGMGFIVAAIALAVSGMGQGWWFWLFIPAFAGLGKGLAEMIMARDAQKKALATPTTTPTTAPQPARVTGELPPQPDFSRMPQPSITEDTTRHLDAVRRKEGQSQSSS
jgi:zinc ribbon protein